MLPLTFFSVVVASPDDQRYSCLVSLLKGLSDSKHVSISPFYGNGVSYPHSYPDTTAALSRACVLYGRVLQPPLRYQRSSLDREREVKRIDSRSSDYRVDPNLESATPLGDFDLLAH